MEFNGKPWFSHVRYFSGLGPSRHERWGLVRLILRRVGRFRRDCVVLMEPAATRPHYVLTWYGGRRLEWQFESYGSDWPALEVVKVDELMRLEQVHPDFADLAERHGLRATPSNTPDTREERRAARFFTNVF